MENNKAPPAANSLPMDDEDQEIVAKLNTIITDAFESVAKLTRLPLKEVLHIVEEVDVDKLKEATDHVIKKIAHCTDLDRAHINRVFQEHHDATIEEIVMRLHERSRANRSKW